MVRHSLASALLGLVLVCAAPVFAQAPVLTPSHIQVAREVMDLTGVTQTITGIYKEFEENAPQLIATRPELKKDVDAIVAELKPEADKRAEEMAKLVAEAFARKMSEADLKGVADFFKSPLGQTYSKMRGEAMNDVLPVLQPWSVQTSNYLFDRLSQEMRKRGHTL
ncbi:MAG: DUF2059 domain-containing protein [Bosea sp.]|uniref:DUF2059 domain-containing protein n=1 Tax=unclassified Bosea (in: a-proteobacteria) TaxID=2653178 RepID=UPI00095CD22A|nr:MULTISPECIES: DUF2059 domain-containing protein [unclassified Bosea (in: a-proteobacteria)]MBN9442652.1 DUF2059 domain-containing protein [Bosea sp. (in: a-proteobacteria)]MBN9456574.1 DUF2059 domain-containing protein [Bosea sp. (in: a-proteobacteria)]OJV08815.1 MAG: hypothetical protein BGO20_21295 [Bosea sp. 67-29]